MNKFLAALLLCFLVSCNNPKDNLVLYDSEGNAYVLVKDWGNEYNGFKIPKKQKSQPTPRPTPPPYEPTKRN